MRHNIAILGLPRSGKTTKAIQLWDNFSGSSIFVNTQCEDYFNNRKDVHIITDYRKWTPKIKRCVYVPEQRSDLIDFIDALFLYQQKSKIMTPIMIVIDEVFHYQDEHPDAIYQLRRLVVDGLRWNICTVITAHMPTMVDAKIYKNIHIFYFFELNSAIYYYFKSVWRIDLFPYIQHLSAPNQYNYILYDMRSFIKGYGKDTKGGNDGLQSKAPENKEE